MASGFHVTRPIRMRRSFFYEFELTDAQSILAKRGFTPTNISLFPLPENLKLSVIDSKIVLDEGKKWRNVFDEVISAKP